MNEKKEINYQFKILYAIGMFFVVANHCQNGGISVFYEFFPAYSFHMGLFVFCSGYFYKDAVENNIGKYIIKKTKKLLVPLYMWNFFYALFAQIMSLRGFSFGTGVTFKQLFLMPLTNGHQYVYNLATWFVCPLFMVEVFNVIYRKALSCIRDNVKEYMYVAISFVMGMLGIWLSSKGLNTGWWLVLTRFLHFVPFYCGGYFYKKILERKDTLSNTLYFSIVICLQLGIIWYKGGTLAYEQAWCRFDEFNAWPYIVGFLGIAFWLRIACVLEPVIGKSKVVNLIADNSFSIMVNQFLGFMFVKSIFATLFRYTNTLFQDFSWNEYHTNIWYYYLPKGLTQMYIIYEVGAIVLAIVIQKMITGLKLKLGEGAHDSQIKLFLGGIVLCVVMGCTAYGISIHVQRNGGVQIPSITNYKLGQMLYFNAKHGNGIRYGEAGLSACESNFTWTDGKEVDFKFDIDGISSDLVLNLTCGIYGESQKLKLYVNGIYVTTIEVTKDIHDYEMTLPYSAIGKSDEILITFELPNATSPITKGEGNDPRILGLSIEKMVIRSCTN